VLGLMGAGKTSVGALLAEGLGRPMRDSDADLAARHGMTASEIADRHGREYLHDLEARHLLDALGERPTPVVCAAASVVGRPDCRQALGAAYVVWLDAPPDVLADRFESGPHRPRYHADVRVMLAEQDARRRPHFAAVADLVVDVSTRDPHQVVPIVLEGLR
jgi:shikimate kinase